MKNTLKRVLCLALAIVMVMGLGSTALAAVTTFYEFPLKSSATLYYNNYEDADAKLNEYDVYDVLFSGNIRPAPTAADKNNKEVIRWEIDRSYTGNTDVIDKYFEITETGTITVKELPITTTGGTNRVNDLKVRVKAFYHNTTEETSSTCVITVTPDAIDTCSITNSKGKEFTDTDLELNLNSDKSIQIKVAAEWDSGKAADPTYCAVVTDNEDILTTPGRPSEAGVVKLSTATRPGDVKVTAAWYGNVTATADFYVSDVRTVVVAPKSNDDDNTLEVNETLKLDFAAYNSEEPEDKNLTDNYVSKNIVWKSSDEKVATVSDAGVVTAVKSGNVKITATVGGVVSNEYAVKVTKPALSGSKLNTKTVDLVVGKGDTIKVITTPKDGLVYGADKDYYVEWQLIENNKVVKTSSNIHDGEYVELDVRDEIAILTGKKAGNAVVRATVHAKEGGIASVTHECDITVGAVKAGTTEDSTTTNTSLSMADIASHINDVYETNYSADIPDSAEIKFSNISGSGTLSAGSNSITNGEEISFEEFKAATFKSSSATTWTADYTITSGDNNMSGDISIEVTSGTVNVSAYITDDGDGYSFSSGVAGTMRTRIENALNTTSYSVKFGTYGTSSVGTLYTSSSKYSEAYGETVSRSSLNYLYFEAKASGNFRVSFTVVNGSGTQLATGTLTLYVTGQSSDVTIHLDGMDTYTFSDETEEDETSAYDEIEDIVDDRNFAYIEFTDLGDSDIGTLYDGDDDEVDADDDLQFWTDDYEDDEDYLISQLYFVPEEEGTYEIEFRAYDDDEDRIGTYTLSIVVPEGKSSSGAFDLAINTETKEDVQLDEDMFIDWFQSMTSSSYDLGYISFDKIDGNGTFYYDDEDESFDEDDNYKKLYFGTSTWDGDEDVDDDIDNLIFGAPSSAGRTVIEFTCYGGSDTDEDDEEESGVLYIFYTKGQVKDVTVEVKNSGSFTLDEDDFESVYKTAMGVTSVPKHYIELMDVPSKGALYYGYSNTSKPGTKLTSKNLDDYQLYVGSSTSKDDSVEDITYVPATIATGSVGVNYIAYSSSGTPLYIGTISFDYGKTSDKITSYAEGYTFKLSDFYASSDKDPIATLYFTQPTNGTLYVNYAKGSGTEITSSTKLYTVYAAKGSYPVSSLTYIPKAGYTGTVNISYTSTTNAGKVGSGTVSITVADKTKSSTFSDVGTSLSWAAGSVDFAQKWGLVNGITTTTFGPNSTMNRAQLVTILYRAAGEPSVAGIANPFKDVPSNMYYYNAVLWASKNGIVTGTSTTTFGPNGNVTREQVATFLYRYAKYKGISVTTTSTLSSYTDRAKVSSYAIEPMTWAVAKGIITGTTTTTLSPTGTATRAQVAVMLHRFLTY